MRHWSLLLASSRARMRVRQLGQSLSLWRLQVRRRLQLRANRAHRWATFSLRLAHRHVADRAHDTALQFVLVQHAARQTSAARQRNLTLAAVQLWRRRLRLAVVDRACQHQEQAAIIAIASKALQAWHASSRQWRMCQVSYQTLTLQRARQAKSTALCRWRSGLAHMKALHTQATRHLHVRRPALQRQCLRLWRLRLTQKLHVVVLLQRVAAGLLRPVCPLLDLHPGPQHQLTFVLESVFQSGLVRCCWWMWRAMRSRRVLEQSLCVQQQAACRAYLLRYAWTQWAARLHSSQLARQHLQAHQVTALRDLFWIWRRRATRRTFHTLLLRRVQSQHHQQVLRATLYFWASRAAANSLARALAMRRQLQRAWTGWLHRSRDLQEATVTADTLRRARDLAGLTSVLQAWRSLTTRVRRVKEMSAQLLRLRVWAALRSTVQRANAATAHNNLSCQLRAFVVWRRQTEMVRQERAVNTTCCVRRLFAVWRKHAAALRDARVHDRTRCERRQWSAWRRQTAALQSARTHHAIQSQRRLFLLWRQEITALQIIRRKQARQCLQHFFSVWHRRTARLRQQSALCVERLSLLALCAMFRTWKTKAAIVSEVMLANATRSNHTRLVRGHWRRWVACVHIKQTLQRLAQEHDDSGCLQRAFRLWRSRAKLSIVAVNLAETLLSRRALGCWQRVLTHLAHLQRTAVMHHTLHALRSVFLLWAVRAVVASTGTLFLQHRSRRHQKQLLGLWYRQTGRLSAAQRFRMVSLQRAALCCWRLRLGLCVAARRACTRSLLRRCCLEWRQQMALSHHLREHLCRLKTAPILALLAWGRTNLSACHRTHQCTVEHGALLQRMVGGWQGIVHACREQARTQQAKSLSRLLRCTLKLWQHRRQQLALASVFKAAALERWRARVFLRWRQLVAVSNRVRRQGSQHRLVAALQCWRTRARSHQVLSVLSGHVHVTHNRILLRAVLRVWMCRANMYTRSRHWIQGRLAALLRLCLRGWGCRARTTLACSRATQIRCNRHLLSSAFANWRCSLQQR